MQKIIHHIWVGPYEMPERERLFVERTRTMHPAFEHRLWTDANLPELPTKVRDQIDRWTEDRVYAFQADVLRVFLVWLHGGVYLDVDMEPVAGFHGLDMDVNGLFHYNDANDHTIPNDTIGLTKGHPLAQYLYDSITGANATYGPHWLGEYTRRYLGVHQSASHREVGEALGKQAITYMPSIARQNEQPQWADGRYFEQHFSHRALYSWSDENKAVARRLHHGLPEIWNTPGGGFGDMWAAVNYLLQKSAAEKRQLLVSRYAGFKKGADHWQTLIDMLALIDAPTGADVQVADDIANKQMAMDCFPGRHLPARVRWTPNKSRVFAIQFDGKSSADKKCPHPSAIRRFNDWAALRGIRLIPVGLPMHMNESARILSRAELFFGVCSGMSHLAHSVGTPCHLVEYEMKVAWWHGKNDFTVHQGMDAFMRMYEEQA